MGLHTKAFDENLSTIFDELQIARQWGQASIILTVHPSSFSQEKTKKVLRKKIESLGCKVIELEANKFNENFIETMLQQDDLENVAFFVSKLDWGGGEDGKDNYRRLNLYRETFIEQKIKVIFFLTLNEASTLPAFAPDFWAFRHRVFGFANPRAPNSKKPPVGVLLWQEEGEISQNATSNTNVAGLQTMLVDIPDRDESISIRVDIQYELGYSYWKEGDLLNAEKNLKIGFDLIKAYNLIYAMKKFVNGLAILYYEQGKYTKALEILEPLISENSRDCLLQLNHAIILFANNQRYKAITKGKKAISLCPQNPWLWNSLGFLYYFAGKLYEAMTCFQKAIDISPNSGYFYESLVVCYLALGLQDKANNQLQQGRAQAGNRESFQDILKLCIDSKEKAKHLLKVTIESGKLNNLDLVRDPILSALANQGQFF